ncbi:hypothetical protein CMQ_1026 [Grosmannia clavigera kw1407]|uniref:Uncharacterized protein n=1 Tax=Grosmannia clavigera (strain kw1407 / UAMH 11150) TaxID=655863 RepID=F0XF50_GROCL|nr:uncharacterized protein CMQ_1026 [Grosmannia clavigera kw1407]EFX04098.1 hypothetical protein CMQ_1026 [Grosmannia clavigera kw1407]
MQVHTALPRNTALQAQQAAAPVLASRRWGPYSRHSAASRLETLVFSILFPGHGQQHCFLHRGTRSGTPASAPVSTARVILFSPQYSYGARNLLAGCQRSPHGPHATQLEEMLPSHGRAAAPEPS